MIMAIDKPTTRKEMHEHFMTVQKTILKMRAEGMTMQQIAGALAISKQRVHVYIQDFEKRMTRAQRVLAKKHGTPAEFEVACYKAVPGMVSMDEAKAAIARYEEQWVGAGK